MIGTNHSLTANTCITILRPALHSIDTPVEKSHADSQNSQRNAIPLKPCLQTRANHPPTTSSTPLYTGFNELYMTRVPDTIFLWAWSRWDIFLLSFVRGPWYEAAMNSFSALAKSRLNPWNLITIVIGVLESYIYFLFIFLCVQICLIVYDSRLRTFLMGEAWHGSPYTDCGHPIRPNSSNWKPTLDKFNLLRGFC